MSHSPFSFGTKILAGAASVLLLLLLLGYLLPAEWEAEATAYMPASPAAVFRFLDSPEGWRAWTPWPESGVERSGPPRGEGAGLSWDDAELGSGSFTLSLVTEAERVEYSVEVGGGAMRATGVVILSAEDGGVRVTWREAGDLGRNPLMGYWALSMDRAQSDELAKGLERLATLVQDSSGVRAPWRP